MVPAAGPSMGANRVSAPGPSGSRVPALAPDRVRASRTCSGPTAANQPAQLGKAAASNAHTAARSSPTARVIVTPALAARPAAPGGGR
jgi:hypothetical protein